MQLFFAGGDDRQARQRGRLLGFAVAERAEHFEDFAPGREGPAIGAFVLVHRLHEDDFFVAVVFLAGGRVHLTAAFALLAAVLAGAALHRHGNGAFAAVVVLASVAAP